MRFFGYEWKSLYGENDKEFIWMDDIIISIPVSMPCQRKLEYSIETTVNCNMRTI